MISCAHCQLYNRCILICVKPRTSSAPNAAVTSPAVPKPLPSSNTCIPWNSGDFTDSKVIQAASTLTTGAYNNQKWHEKTSHMKQCDRDAAWCRSSESPRKARSPKHFALLQVVPKGMCSFVGLDPASGKCANLDVLSMQFRFHSNTWQ